MTTRIPVTLEGNLTGDPEHGTGESGNEYARFTVAINDRRLNQRTNLWEDAGTVFHRVVVFDKQARHVADSLHKGDSVVVAGDLRFGSYVDKESGQTRETRDVIADNVGASLKFATVSVERTPIAEGPAAHAPGPSATPASYAGAGITR
ncbi:MULTISPECIES: single-stranded DNA-binding protein [Microbacterium]|jgi:single-strand DNA-binding protein|uniref:single-stranded DNA-binding protein n=1 Tax=Microbacterium TaxID=33882 RepID=UPI001D1720FD|nr:single-stranded DNA-binding protein [Microbacterium testaceum]MCC4248244.1 single-stranded DNA-binding protein [Microbacterium testaceum]